uniref:Adenylyltransferase and sulfurtransferase MOCS3 Molybdenum cofactor synthesis protein 3 n=1 Tax=Rhizophora mucronata TaxID=61149 RepID=A0A2P2KVA0_RHIMU
MLHLSYCSLSALYFCYAVIKQNLFAVMILLRLRSEADHQNVKFVEKMLLLASGDLEILITRSSLSLHCQQFP